MSDVIRQLARETAVKVEAERAINKTVGSAILRDLIEAALLHAQQVQREQDAEIADAISRQLASYDFPSASGAARDVGIAIRKQLATLRSQEISK